MVALTSDSPTFKSATHVIACTHAGTREQSTFTLTKSPRATDNTGQKRADYYHRNQQYSITAVTTSTGTIAERYAYTAYGEPTICDASGSTLSSSSLNNRYSYTGREWDATVGLHHFRARWMSPKTGRFLGRDPIGFAGSEWGLYEVLRSQSLARLDPSGLCPKQGCKAEDRRTHGECCTASRKEKGIDANGFPQPLIGTAVGLTFCCDGRAVTCVYPERLLPRFPTAFPIIVYCVNEHEKSHVPDTAPCPDACPFIDWAEPKKGGPTQVESECKARQAELDCLTSGIQLCFGIEACERDVIRRAKDIFDRTCNHRTDLQSHYLW